MELTISAQLRNCNKIYFLRDLNLEVGMMAPEQNQPILEVARMTRALKGGWEAGQTGEAMLEGLYLG